MGRRGRGGDDEELMELPELPEGEEEEDLEDEDFSAGSDTDEEGGGKSKKAKKKGKKEKAKPKEKQSKKRRNEFVDDVADEDDDEEEEEEEGRGRKRKKRGNVFIDDIADVDDDEEEEEDDDEAEDLIDDKDVEIPEQAEQAGGHAKYRALNREHEDRSAEDIARFIEQKYQAMEERGADYDDGAALTQTGVVGQQALLPTHQDTKLWLVKTRDGSEREAVVQLLSKHYVLMRQGAPLLIKSAISIDHIKGSIYVEADKEAHVREAVRGLRTVLISRGVRLVPLDEMVASITVNRQAKVTLSRGAWVRVRTHKTYKDDLAKVVEVDSMGLKATIRLVPRLDLNELAAKSQMSADERKEERKRHPFGRPNPVRPPARPFVPDEAKELGLVLTRVPGIDGQIYLQLGSNRYINGYEERVIAIKNLTEVEGVPPLEEMQRYNACGAAADDERYGGSAGMGGLAAGAGGALSSLMAALPAGGAPKTTYIKGDPVIVVKGEMKNLQATVEGTDNNGRVVIRPQGVDGFTELVDCEPDELRKLFKVGDQVRVINGTHQGEVGMVVLTREDEQCVVVSDTTKLELRVFARDLTLSDGASTGIEVLGEHQLHDLVQLDNSTAGVIIQIQRDAARVLTSASTPDQPVIRVVRSNEIQRGVKTRNLVTTDKHNNQVRQGDYVTFSSGGTGRATTTRGGNVEYVWRGQLFLRVRDSNEAGGFVCVKANYCSLRGGVVKGKGDGNELARAVANGMTPNRTPNSPFPGMGKSPAVMYAPASPSHFLNTSSSPSGGGSAQPYTGAMPAAPKFGAQAGTYSGRSSHASARHSQLVGKLMRIQGGPYNGYQGRVKNETETHVQMELEAISGRVVTVDKKYLPSAFGGSAAPRATPSQNGSARSGSWAGYGTQYTGRDGPPSQGPSYGSRTPLHPSQTPLHPSMTPMHYSSGGMTPMHAPYTPMHHATTPGDDNYHGSGGYHDHGTAPLHAPTPGSTYHDHGTAPLHAPTPGSTYANTPAGMTPSMYGNPGTAPHAPTPGGPMDLHHAPTPALDMHHPMTAPLTADTPGVAPTPGGHGGGGMSAPTPYMSHPTPGYTPGDAAPTPGLSDLGTGRGYTPGLPMQTGVAPTPGLPGMNQGYTPGFGATPGMAYTPGIAATPGPDH